MPIGKAFWYGRASRWNRGMYSVQWPQPAWPKTKIAAGVVWGTRRSLAQVLRLDVNHIHDERRHEHEQSNHDVHGPVPGTLDPWHAWKPIIAARINFPPKYHSPSVAANETKLAPVRRCPAL